VEIIRPFLPKEKTDDVIFSVEELAAYLRVSPKWVYDHKHELPHFKPGGLLRFRKKDIDKGIDMLFLNVQGKRNPKKEG
jgi:excisionase family DNA binding protein